MNILLSSAYLPPIQYYTKLVQCGSGTAYIEACDNYVKQTYRNRCVIVDANGPLALTIPTEKTTEEKCLMRDIRISDHGNWRHRHWNALEAAYRHTPFFLYYEDDFRPFYEKKHEYLYDFNMELTQLVCDLIGIDIHMEPTAVYGGEQPLTDLRECIHPKQSWHTDTEFSPTEYYQVFKEKHGFIPNMSIVDLLFNMGPESILILHESNRRR
ncbi:MAG: WbqC family protein [Bacteroidaceae bacterium]|jgi:hypothetical protein|nr:WbqC family protein [Bacteroidaceae bacterium]